MSEEKPWMDYDNLLELRDDKDTQEEMAEELGCSVYTVRKHLKRAREEQKQRAVDAGILCERCEENETPGGADTGNSYCASCLDEVRHDE